MKRPWVHFFSFLFGVAILTISCSLGEVDQDLPDDPVPTVVSYQKVQLDDLTPLGLYCNTVPSSAVPPSNPGALPYILQSFTDNWGIVLDMSLDFLENSYGSLIPRSIASSLFISVRDEGFSVLNGNWTSSAGDDELGTDFSIDVLDVLVEGEVNSLSSLIGLMAEADSYPVTAIESEGSIAISGFVSATAYPKSDYYIFPLEVLSSLFVDVSVDHTEPVSSSVYANSLIEGELHLSMGTNLMVTEERRGYRAPMVMQLDMDRMKFDMQSIGSFLDSHGLDGIDNITAVLWPEFAALLWGLSYDDEDIQLRLLFGDAEGEETASFTINGYQAFELMMNRVESLLADS